MCDTHVLTKSVTVDTTTATTAAANTTAVSVRAPGIVPSTEPHQSMAFRLQQQQQQQPQKQCQDQSQNNQPHGAEPILDTVRRNQCTPPAGIPNHKKPTSTLTQPDKSPKSAKSKAAEASVSNHSPLGSCSALSTDLGTPTMKYLTQSEAYTPAPSGPAMCTGRVTNLPQSTMPTSYNTQGSHSRPGNVEELTSEVLGPSSSAPSSSTASSRGVPSLIHQGQQIPSKSSSSHHPHGPTQRKNIAQEKPPAGVIEANGPTSRGCCQSNHHSTYIVNPVK